MGTDYEFEYSEKISSTNLAEYCAKLAEGFKRKGFELHGKGQSITLIPDDVVKIEVKAKSEASKGSLQIEVSWKKEVSDPEDRLQVLTGDKSVPEKS